MQRRLVWVASILALLAGLLFVALRPRAERAVPLPAATNPESPSTSAPAATLTAVAPAVERGREPVVPAAPATAESTNAVPAADALAEVKGRFLLPDGTPAVGVEVALRGWAGNTERARRFGVPKDFVDPTGKSGADGRFSLRIDPPRAFLFLLETKVDGWVAPKWRWNEIAPRAVVDVGDVVLVAGGTLRGRVVDTSGKVLTKGWTIYADGVATNVENQEQPGGFGRPDPATGEFVITPLPPGPVTLRAQSEIAGWIPAPRVEIRAHEETRVDVVYDGPDLSSRITVVVFTKPFYTFSTQDEFEFVLTGTGVPERKAAKQSGSSQSWEFDGVPPGLHRIELRDERYEPWSQDGVEAGTRVNAKLVGSAAVTLDVVDDATSAPLSRYALDVRFDESRTSPNVFRVFDAEVDAPRGPVKGMMPGNQTLIVTAEGRPPVEVAVAKLSPRENRVITVRVPLGRVVTGVVRTTSGRAVEGVRVSASPMVVRNDRTPRRVMMDGGRPETAATSDARGAFTIENLATGKYTLEARLGLDVSSRTSFEMPATGDVEPVALTIPDVGRLVGRLIAPEGATFEGLAVEVAPRASDVSEPTLRVQRTMAMGDAGLLSIAADGGFVSGVLPVGDVDVSLVPSQRRIATGDRTWTRSMAPATELDTVRIVADGDTRHEFDVRGTFPATCEARVTVNGTPPTGAIVVVRRGSPSQILAGGVTDSQGACRMRGMPVGATTIVASASDGSWTSLPLVVTFAANETRVVSIDVALASGEIVVRSGEPPVPLTNRSLHLDCRVGEETVTSTVKTDTSGIARVALVPGRWSVRFHDFDGRSPVVLAASVDWGGGRVEIDLKPEPR